MKEKTGNGTLIPTSLNVLIHQSDDQCLQKLESALKNNFLCVDAAADSVKADMLARTNRYDVIICDTMERNGDYTRLLRNWRRDGISARIMVLTKANEVRDKVECLDQGADDYITIPFETDELLARLRALTRRSANNQVLNKRVFRCFDLEIDTSSETVKRSGDVITLTPREFDLLKLLAFYQGRLVTRSMIWEKLYDRYSMRSSNVVDVYIRRLRTKIDKKYDPTLILTRFGKGYMLRAEDE